MLSPLESLEGILVTAAIRDISVRKKAETLLLRTVEELKRRTRSWRNLLTLLLTICRSLSGW